MVDQSSVAEQVVPKRFRINPELQIGQLFAAMFFSITIAGGLLPFYLGALDRMSKIELDAGKRETRVAFLEGEVRRLQDDSRTTNSDWSNKLDAIKTSINSLQLALAAKGIK